MLISRRWAVFLVLVGVWTWLIWPRFGVAIWRDDRSFSGGAPTSFLWVHALLIVASLAIGTTVACSASKLFADPAGGRKINGRLPGPPGILR